MHKKIGISLNDVLGQYNNGLLAKQVHHDAIPDGPTTLRRFKRGLMVIIGNGTCDLTDFGDVVYFAIVK